MTRRYAAVLHEYQIGGGAAGTKGDRCGEAELHRKSSGKATSDCTAAGWQRYYQTNRDPKWNEYYIFAKIPV